MYPQYYLVSYSYKKKKKSKWKFSHTITSMHPFDWETNESKNDKYDTVLISYQRISPEEAEKYFIGSLTIILPKGDD